MISRCGSGRRKSWASGRKCDPGSARVSRAGDGVPPSRTFPVSDYRQRWERSGRCTKVRLGGTPRPARETRALPGRKTRGRGSDRRGLRPPVVELTGGTRAAEGAGFVARFVGVKLLAQIFGRVIEERLRPDGAGLGTPVHVPKFIDVKIAAAGAALERRACRRAPAVCDSSKNPSSFSAGCRRCAGRLSLPRAEA